MSRPACCGSCYGSRVRRLVIAWMLLGLVRPVAAETQPQAQTVDEKSERTGSAVHPTQLMRERQIRESEGEGGRSGFWTSREPAKGGAYRWRLLGIGMILVIVMGGAILLLIKRANRANAARSKG